MLRTPALADRVASRSAQRRARRNGVPRPARWTGCGRARRDDAWRCAVTARITRRKVIASFAAASGALGGRFFGLFPEIPSARPAASGAGVRVDPPPTIADIVKVDFDQAELARRYAAVAADREIIALRPRAAQEGLDD